MQVRNLLREATGKLSHVSESAALDASLLLMHATAFSQVDLFLKDTETLADEQLVTYNDLLQRRLQGEPIAYILGEKEFWGLPFKVQKGVLIPRPDSETLVATLMASLPHKNAELKIADLGVGSGALLLSILSEYPQFHGMGVDMNDTALQIAKENAENLGFSERCSFVKSHWLDDIDETFDIIISNPPYIESSTISTLMEDVKGFEPLTALDGGDDGLDCYRSLIPSACAKMVKGGLLLLEIGYNQKEAVSALLEESFEGIQCFKDLAGHDRVVAAVKK